MFTSVNTKITHRFYLCLKVYLKIITNGDILEWKWGLLFLQIYFAWLNKKSMTCLREAILAIRKYNCYKVDSLGNKTLGHDMTPGCYRNSEKCRLSLKSVNRDKSLVSFHCVIPAFPILFFYHNCWLYTLKIG